MEFYPTHDDVLNIIDKALKFMPDHDSIGISAAVDQSDLPASAREIAHTYPNLFERMLVRELAYAEFNDEGSEDRFLKLTPAGIESRKAGGHFVYFKQLEEKSIADKQRQLFNDEKLTYDVKNTRRIFKTYWWTFAISIAAFLIALFNLVYNLFLK